MAPDVTWTRLLEVYRESNWPLVLMRSEALLTWLERDGFPPQNLKQTLGVDDAATNVIAYAFSNHAHQRARKEGHDVS